MYVIEDGIAVQTFIETGIYDDSYITVTGGLTAGSRVITGWSSSLSDGMAVTESDSSADAVPDAAAQKGAAS